MSLNNEKSEILSKNQSFKRGRIGTEAIKAYPWLKDWIAENDLSGEIIGSTKIVTSICPYCGFKRQVKIKNIIKAIIKCPNCSDGISYPNKFGRSFIMQLPISNLITEYGITSQDGIKYKYDIYFEYRNQKYVVEMDGGYHYLLTHNHLNFEELKRRRNMDKIKDGLANDKGITIIRIDCKESNPNYIKNNILNSKLCLIFDLSNIDWDKCAIEAESNLMKKVIDVYNQKQFHVLKEIADQFNIDVSTVHLYIARGKDLGICESNFNESYRKRHWLDGVSVEVFDANKKLIGTYPSIAQATKEMNKKYQDIIFVRHAICKKVNFTEELISTYKGFYFRRLRKEA